ncbi:hypothetical protein SAMN04487936_111121 [Halobacillus dabanensis]|uniref:YfzA-like protein n=1 Tax=Halobacillus dabanensis TaxID=240302 RepID=A0A1I3YQD4_HALDA|nr:hypothetical protein [Halobacillus dabanensis]SFK34005.1 hypothetical protein SAMN04487936_111121 [Halobacillus dabanensis]
MSLISKTMTGIGWLIMVIAALMLFKAVGLFTVGTNVDGDGIGIHFLGMEINDRVPETEIPMYATQFLMYGSTTLLIALIMFVPALWYRFKVKRS